jgi:hypothetical protein
MAQRKKTFKSKPKQRSVRQAKQAIVRGSNMSLSDGLVFETEAYYRTIPTEDRREGITSFNEKRIAGEIRRSALRSLMASECVELKVDPGPNNAVLDRDIFRYRAAANKGRRCLGKRGADVHEKVL